MVSRLGAVQQRFYDPQYLDQNCPQGSAISLVKRIGNDQFTLRHRVSLGDGDRKFTLKVADGDDPILDAINDSFDVSHEDASFEENPFRISYFRRFTSSPTTSQKPMQHLALRESISYLDNFLKELVGVAHNSRELSRKIESMRNVAFDQVVGEKGIYKSFKLLRPFSSNSSTARLIQSKKIEKIKLSKTAGILKELMYDALALLSKYMKIYYPSEEFNIAKIHKRCCQNLAIKAQKEFTVNGKIKIKTSWPNVIKDPSGTEIEYIHSLTQLTSDFYGSLTKRDGKAGGINVHKGCIYIGFPGGHKGQFLNSELRTGSFDFDLVKADKILRKEFKISEKKAERTWKKLDGKSDQEIEALLEKISVDCAKLRTTEEKILLVKEYAKNVSALKIGEYKNLKRHEQLLEDLINEIAIIHHNCIVMLDVFQIAEEEGIGFPLPIEITNLFPKEDGRYAMISLQTPFHCTDPNSLKGVTAFFAKSQLTSDNNELFPIYREMRALQELQTVQKEVKEGLYLNLPTNFLGKNPSKANMLCDKDLKTATVKDEIDQATKTSLHSLYFQAKERITLLNYEIATLTLQLKKYRKRSKRIDVDIREEYYNLRQIVSAYKWYKQVLEDLLEQIFTIDENKNPVLKSDPQANTAHMRKKISGEHKEKTAYEIPARINTLFKLLGYTTTFHCRSGNNRTAAMAAKSHQIALLLLSDFKNHLPSSEELAGELAKGVKEDHWSKKVYLKGYEISLKLQKANKGTEGTKLKVPESSPVFTMGAFKIAGRFEEEMLEQAKERLSKLQHPFWISNK